MATKVKLIETGAVTGNIIPDGGIATGKLADDAVTTIKISDGNITHEKLHTSMDLTDKTVTVATAAGSTNTTAAASTAFVQQELTTLIGGAPSTLNDLNELAAAINNDANYNSTLTTALATKLPLAGGAMTGAITTNSTFDGVDIAARDAVLTSTTTTANAALPLAGGAMTGNLTVNAIVDADNFKINGGQGTDGQVLTSTGSGIAWETVASGVADGAVTSAKLDTNIAITGTLTVGSHLSMGDDDYLKMGVSDDLQIYHTQNSDSYISASSGNLVIQNTRYNKDIIIKSDDSSGNGLANYFLADGSSGKVELYHYGSRKFTTEPTGIDVTGTVNLDNLTINGAQGSDGQVLTSTGSGIAWEAVASGGEGLPLTGGTLTGSLYVIKSGPSHLKVESTSANGNDVYLSIKNPATEWLIKSNRGDQIGGNQGDLFFRDNTNGKNVLLLQTNTGYVGIGDMTPAYRLELPNTANAAGQIRAHAFVTFSDSRVKSNIQTLTYGLDIVKQLKPSQYKHHNSIKENGQFIKQDEGANDIGFIAQEVLPLIPEVVSVPKDTDKDLYSISYPKLTAVLTKAIQEQQALIESQATTIADLTTRLETLENA